MAKTFEAFEKSKFRSLNDLEISTPDSHSNNLEHSKISAIANLSQKLFFDSAKAKIKIFNFMCSRKGEGTSSVLIHLKEYLMEKGSVGRVLFIDANRIHPVLHTYFGIEQYPGLYEALVDVNKCKESIHRIEDSDIYLMPNGSTGSSHSDIFDNTRLADLFSKLRKVFDYIIIDSAPLLQTSDSILSAIHADASFLIIQAHMTQREVVKRAKDYLKEHNCGLRGVVLNRIVHPVPQWLYNRL